MQAKYFDKNEKEIAMDAKKTAPNVQTSRKCIPFPICLWHEEQPSKQAYE